MIQNGKNVCSAYNVARRGYEPTEEEQEAVLDKIDDEMNRFADLLLDMWREQRKGNRQ